jgi:uncharacterized small protein (DUF1192 family)
VQSADLSARAHHCYAHGAHGGITESGFCTIASAAFAHPTEVHQPQCFDGLSRSGIRFASALASGEKPKPAGKGSTMNSTVSLAELDKRIAIVRDNIRQLIEQAAAQSGAEDEDRNADRIARQNEELDRLMKQRDALAKK